MSGARPERKSFEHYLKRVGQKPRLFTDLYAFMLRARWPIVVALFAGAFVAVNFAFALLYWAVPGSVANSDGSLADAFYFSVQTFGSIGYGHMYAQGHWGNSVVVAEAFFSLLFLAVLTGLVFAKFARPRARVLFSDRALVETRDGKPTLTFRLANERGNDVVEASLHVAVLKTQLSAEGKRMRRFFDLSLERERTPLFILSWQVFHVIDEDSPLYGMSAQDCVDDDVRLTVTMTGHDGTFSQTVHARHMYWAEEILFDHKFVDVIEEAGGGHVVMDYRKFHSVEPE